MLSVDRLLLGYYSAIAPWTLYRCRFLDDVPLSLLGQCFAIAPWIMFRYRSLDNVPLPLLGFTS